MLLGLDLFVTDRGVFLFFFELFGLLYHFTRSLIPFCTTHFNGTLRYISLQAIMQADYSFPLKYQSVFSNRIRTPPKARLMIKRSLFSQRTVGFRSDLRMRASFNAIIRYKIADFLFLPAMLVTELPRYDFSLLFMWAPTCKTLKTREMTSRDNRLRAEKL